MWEKVVRNPKLLLLVLVVFFLIVFLWDRGFEPEGVFIPPDLEPGKELIVPEQSENFSLDLELFVGEKEESLYDFNWVLEVEVREELPELEVYGLLPMQIEEYYAGEKVFPAWLREVTGQDGELKIEEQRILNIAEGEKEKVTDLARWVMVIIIWKEGEEYLEVKIPTEEIKW